MSGLPFYKAYPRDFIEGTIGLTFEEKGAYRLVLDLIYMQGGQLPDDARYISGLLGCTLRKWNSLRSRLIEIGKLEVSGEFLTNKRAVLELETLAKHQDKQRENRSRPNKNNDIQSPRSDHTEPDTEPDKKEPKGSKKAGRKVSYSDEFEAWWKEYPAKVGGSKIEAFKCWQAMDAEDRELALLALPVYRAHLAEPDAPKAAYATTFLNQRRYDTLQPPETDWAKFVGACQEFGFWTDTLGPKPGELGCKAPAEIQREYGFEPQIGSAA